MGDDAFDMICAAETGECIHQIFAKGSEFIGQTLGLSSQRFKVEEYAAILSKAFDDKKFIAGTVSKGPFIYDVHAEGRGSCSGGRIWMGEGYYTKIRSPDVILSTHAKMFEVFCTRMFSSDGITMDVISAISRGK